MDSPPSRGVHRRLAIHPVWVLNAVLAAAALALWAGHVRGLSAPATSITLPWWGLALGFAATELTIVHIHVRRTAHSLSLSDLPLVLGLLFASPTSIAVAWVAGAGLALAVSRGEPLKVAFNLVQFALVALVAATVFHAVAPGIAAVGPAAWGGALGAVVASGVAGALLIVLAIALIERRVARSKVREMVVLAVAVAATNACLALAAALVIEADPRGAVFLLGPAVVIYAAYRAYLSERRQKEGFAFLHEVSAALARTADTAPAVAAMLARSRENFRAEVAEVCLFAGGQPLRTVLGPGEGVEVMQPLEPAIADALRGLVDGPVHSRLVETAGLHAPLEEYLGGRGVTNAMVAALPGDDRLVGVMLLGNRLGVEKRFKAADLHLLETLANQAGATLEQDRLERSISELREIQEDLEHRAFHDPLTGLANRLLFTNRVKHALSRRSGNVIVMYIDLDDFKPINDTLGHEAGDAVLVATADRLRTALRDADTPARLGGDEFAVLLVDVLEKDVPTVADRILRGLRVPIPVTGQEAKVGASLGIAMADSGSMPADELLRNADVAMYASKHGGKHRYSVFEGGMQLPGAAPVGAA